MNKNSSKFTIWIPLAILVFYILYSQLNSTSSYYSGFLWRKNIGPDLFVLLIFVLLVFSLPISSRLALRRSEEYIFLSLLYMLFLFSLYLILSLDFFIKMIIIGIMIIIGGLSSYLLVVLDKKD